MAREENTQRGELDGTREAGGGDGGRTDELQTTGDATDVGGDSGRAAEDAAVLGRSAGGDGPGVVQRVEDIDVECVSADAWRLLRTAAGYEQRAIERELDELKQAHISMLENDTRSLSTERLERLFDLYTADLTDEQVCALVDLF